MFAIISPNPTQSADVNAYSPTTFTPMFRSFFKSPKLATPAVMEKNTIGTTIILIIFKKTVPSGFTMVAFSPNTSPMTIPRPKPINVFAARLNFFFSFMNIPFLLQNPSFYILSQISFPQMSSGREVSAFPGKFPNLPAKHAFRELFRMSCIPEMHLCHVLQLICSCHRTV